MKGLSTRPSSLSGAVYLIEAPICRRETLILETREITDSAARAFKSPAKRAILLAVHQLLATIGVLLLGFAADKSCSGNSKDLGAYSSR